ncbi:MAG: SDR family NAD(P)-dependent oxidoreductase, partial [Bryobacteraceae bacterium]
MIQDDTFSLEGKTALVAGASRGIGLAIARLAAQAGARTILAARSMDKLREHAGAIVKAGYKGEAAELDICDQNSIQALTEKFPEIDI